ncbi:hypothetical protein Tco_0766784, partial [Tanacetum coccineum]
YERPHKGVKASANSDVMYFFTSAQDGDPLQDDVRLCLGDDLKKAQDHRVTSLRMPPKRTSTSEAPAITLAVIQQLITNGITTALEAQAITMANTSNPNRNTGPTGTPVAKNGKLQRIHKLSTFLLQWYVLEDMDAYRDEGMGDVIVGEPFLREVGIKARRFDGMITIYNGNDEVTYQMVRSHPRFKRHTNEQCNKIPPLLKVSEKDEKNGISHAYQKLKGFYKGFLNQRPDYIRNAKTEEWITRGHISMHEME